MTGRFLAKLESFYIYIYTLEVLLLYLELCDMSSIHVLYIYIYS